MAKQPSYKTIAGDLDCQVQYLVHRCLEAEGKDPDDPNVMREIMGDVLQEAPHTRTRRSL
jgi:hypothetical protein